MDQYVDQFELDMLNGEYSGARTAINKILTIVNQCKLDVDTLKRMETKKEDGPPFPKYAKLGESALFHKGKGVYYRDAGMWEVRAKWKEGKLVAVTRKGPMASAYGEELVECTNEEWRDDNQGYL